MEIIHKPKLSKFVAKDKGKLAGYLKYIYPEDPSGKRNLEISYIFVKDNYRRRGIATKLIETLLDCFPKITWISLWTGKQTEIDKSYNLYNKLGFSEKFYQRDYYEPGVGTRLFVKRIS